MTTKPSTVEEYVASFPPDVQQVLRVLRQTIYATTPNATETIRYAMPAVVLDGRYVIHYAAWKHHIGLYPVPLMSAELEAEVASYRTTKNTVRLPLGTPLPVDVIRRILTELITRRKPARAR